MARWILIPLLTLAAGVPAVLAAPKADLWARWEAHDPGSTQRVDHQPWQAFLARYLDAAHPSGIARVRYASVAAADR